MSKKNATPAEPQLTDDEKAAKALAEFDAQVEAAVRAQAAETPSDQALKNLLATLDSRRAIGETVILRIDDATKKIAVVQFTPVTVSLAELEAAADLAEDVLADEEAERQAETANAVADSAIAADFNAGN